MLYFPEGTKIREVREIRDNYKQIDIEFPKGGIITWYRLQALGSSEIHNRIGRAAAAANRFGSFHPPE